MDDHEELLCTDLTLFNRTLAEWLIFSNAVRPHHALGQQSLLSFLPQHQPECQRYGTHTTTCILSLPWLYTRTWWLPGAGAMACAFSSVG